MVLLGLDMHVSNPSRLVMLRYNISNQICTGISAPKDFEAIDRQHSLCICSIGNSTGADTKMSNIERLACSWSLNLDLQGTQFCAR